MSLFEDNRYQYRDTFFIFFPKQNRPSTQRVLDALKSLGAKYEIQNARESDTGFESVSVISPHDCSAMDIAYEASDEVKAQIRDLLEEFRTLTLRGDDAEKLQRLQKFDARFDIFHFERVVDNSEDEALDPGGLLMVMQTLTELVDGIGLDPQSQALM